MMTTPEEADLRTAELRPTASKTLLDQANAFRELSSSFALDDA